MRRERERRRRGAAATARDRTRALRREAQAATPAITTRVCDRWDWCLCAPGRTALLVFVRVTNPDLTKCVDAGTGCDYLSGGGTPGPRLFVLRCICTSRQPRTDKNGGQDKRDRRDRRAKQANRSGRKLWNSPGFGWTRHNPMRGSRGSIVCLEKEEHNSLSIDHNTTMASTMGAATWRF